MSGHSKWAQIKRQKGVADVKRGKMFTKLANAITIAVRSGGGIIDPNSNFKLRLAIDRARSYNMPKENIERSIKRALGKEGSQMEEVVYEGFGPGNIAIIIEAVTDNRQRTTSEIKIFLEKNGGVLATPGAVSYQFKQKGLITLNKDKTAFDDVFMIAADAGAEDVEDADGQALIYTKPEDLNNVKERFIRQGFTVINAELIRKSLSPILVNDKEHASKILSFVEKLEELDDVQRVYANFDIPDSIVKDIRSG